MKKCAICKIPKTISEFHKRKNSKDGFSYICKECKAKNNKEYREKNPEYDKQWQKSNFEKLKIIRKKWRKNNHEKWRKNHREYYRKWREENPEREKKYRKNKYLKKRRNPSFRLRNNISTLIRNSLKGKKNGKHWESLVGYTQGDLRKHLETQFKDGMSWDNYGRNGWNIDHKIPVSLFNITSAKCKGFKACWALENLQPMWEKDNLEKSNKIFC